MGILKPGREGERQGSKCDLVKGEQVCIQEKGD